MNPDEKRYERRFRCPACQEPIFSRIGSCTHCGTGFGADTLFSCPKCGALVKQLELVCPACGVKMMDWGITSEEMGFAVPKVEPGPMIAKPISELKMERPIRRRLVAPRKLITTDREMPKQKFFDLREKGVPPPRPPQKIQGKAAPTKISRTDAMRGRTNGMRTGRVNGTQQGRINGTRMGRINGTQQGRVNGTKQGRVNGTKEQLPMMLAKPSSRLQTPIVGRLILWQLLIVLGICAILISSAVLIFFIPYNQGQHRMTIDGDFSDWANVPSYRFSALLPGTIPEIAESKLSYSEDSLYMYFHFEDLAFSGSNASTVYAFIDTDEDPNTGYRLSSHFGADSIIALTGWDGVAREGGYSHFGQSSDNSNWSMWQVWNKPTMAVSQREVEMSVYEPSGNPKVELMSVSDGKEERGPMMSTAGTVVAVQNPKFSGGVLTNPLQSVMTVSLIVMGVPGGEISVQSGLVNGSGVQFGGGSVVVSSTDWTTANFSADLSGYMAGDSFSFAFAGTATSFTGPLDVMGEPSRGYYLSAPSKITVDGLFGDWTGRKFSDNDTTPLGNPNIDIKEYGAATQSNSHFFYVGVNGEALGGADVPEQRSKTVPGGGSPSPEVRLRKTGEDLLQAFIDKDPGMATGKWVTAQNASIFADYLIEIYGRDGVAITNVVKSWSDSDQEWKTIGGVEKIGVGANGVEFSVSKTLLANLTNSDIIFFTTDWKARSDNCRLQGGMGDPWASTSTGSVYQSWDGASWSLVDGSIPLVGGEHVVDMCASVADDIVFVVTDAGRLYEWVMSSNTTWHASITNPQDHHGTPLPTNITSVTSSGVAANAIQVYIMNKAGYLWSITANQWNPKLDWVDDTRGRIDNHGDFKDIDYSDAPSTKDFVALRSTQNTGIYIFDTNTPASFPVTAEPNTGSTSPQVSVYHTYVGGGTKEYRIWILCENGNIRYSNDSTKGNEGHTWYSRGNLPLPGSGTPTLPSYSKYVGIDIDSGGTFWVITNTSYCYKSTDSGVTWSYTGNINVKTIAAFCAPIPEFTSVLIPIMAVILPIIAITRKRRRQP